MKTKALLAIGVLLLTLAAGQPAETQGPSDQWILEEARTVYLGNLARRANGVPPLRWNRQLSAAARWFAWDSVENRPNPYCGHQDTEGGWPDDRAVTFGYKGMAGAENAFCGYVTPEQAIEGWLNSPGHRANLLDPNHREIGLGYYRRSSDGRGYVAQPFGRDPVFPPVIINNEALTTTTPTVDLYIYDRMPGGGFAEMGAAIEMRLGNDSCLSGREWEAYTAEKAWTVPAGTGWRSVYVQTRDTLGRSFTVSDTIYLGGSIPVGELSLAHASTTTETVTIYNLDGTARPQVQFSANWMADDTFDTFALNWGNGEQVDDQDAKGGTAFRLTPGAGESYAWVWTTEFIKEMPLVAYIRLKASDNSEKGEVARFSIDGGGTTYGPLSLAGSDFDASNQYQEFMLPFTFHENPDSPFLIFNFWRSGNADVYVDLVTIFSEPVPVTSPLIWQVPGGNYRGQGILQRYTDGSNSFSPIGEAQLQRGTTLGLIPEALTFSALAGVSISPSQVVTVQTGCPSLPWQASSDAAWLLVKEAEDDTLRVWVETAQLTAGSYTATITVTIGNEVFTLPVTLDVLDVAGMLYLPALFGS